MDKQAGFRNLESGDGEQLSWAEMVLGGAFGSIGGVGMLAYLMEKINRKRDFRRGDIDIRDCCTWTLISMRPCFITMPQDEAKEQICAYYQVIDKFLSKTEAYNRLLKSVPEYIEDKNSAVMDLLVYGDLSLVDETVLVMIACNGTLIKDALDENSDFIGECYKFAEMFVGQMKSYEKHQQRIKEMEDEYNKQKQQKECSTEGQSKCEFDTEVESVDQKNKTEK